MSDPTKGPNGVSIAERLRAAAVSPKSIDLVILAGEVAALELSYDELVAALRASHIAHCDCTLPDEDTDPHCLRWRREVLRKAGAL